MVYGILSTICPFEGAAARTHRFRGPAPRIGAIRPGSRKNRAPCRDLASFPRSSGLPAGPIAVNHPPFLSKTEPCFAARARQSCATFDGYARYLRPFIIISLNAEQPRPPMSLIYRLASRNLLHDRLRFIATVVGIVFSIVLVTVQLGLYLGFGRIVTTMIDHASADLWIMPVGTKCFEDPSTLDERKRFQALAINGVAQATPVVIGYADWRIPEGGTSPVFIVGSDLRADGLLPWNLVEGSLDALAIPGAVAIDRSYFDRLGISGIGDSADVESVRLGLKANLSDVDVLTTAEFRDRSRSFWLFGTGAGFALFAGALLGMIVGTVIVAQTLYSSTKDHINEFATLRAIGSSSLY